MSSNSGSNGSANTSQYYRKQIYAQNQTPGSVSTGSLPPASELLSPSPTLGYPNKTRHPIHSVVSPNVGPPPLYLGSGNYQPLGEPGTPSFLTPTSADSAPSPSFESTSPASNNHVTKSAESTKPSTPITECGASPVPNGIYSSGTHYQSSQHYYQQSHQQYQRLPSVDTLPSPSNYYPNNTGQMPPLSQASQQHSSVYIRSIDRPSHPAPPGAYMPSSGPSIDGVSVYSNNEEVNEGEYYSDPYNQSPSNDSPATYNYQSSQQAFNRPYPPPQRAPAMKQQVVYQQKQQTPTLQRQVVYQQKTSGQYLSVAAPSHHVVNLYDGTVIEQRSLMHVTPHSPSSLTPNGISVQQQKSSSVSVASASISTQSAVNEAPNSQVEKPKKPPPKRIRKTAAQLRAEQQQKQANNTEEQKPMTANPEVKDSDTNMMPPPKVNEAPSVIAAKAMYNSNTPPSSNNSTPQKPGLQVIQSPINQEANQLNSSAIEVPIVQQQSSTQQQNGLPKRQRSAGQRAQQQQKARQKQKELEMLKLREEREYLVKLVYLRRAVRALVFKNGALADEVARLKMQIDICREERKMVAKRVQHYERNRIRRHQTHERKALARAAAALQQSEQKSTDTAEEDETSQSTDIVLPLNDSSQQRPLINFQSLQEEDLMSSPVESIQKSKIQLQTPRKRSRTSKDSTTDQTPAKRCKQNGSASNTKESSPMTQKQHGHVSDVPMSPEGPVIKQSIFTKRPVGRPEKKNVQSPSDTNIHLEEASSSKKVRNTSKSPKTDRTTPNMILAVTTNTPSTSSSFSLTSSISPTLNTPFSAMNQILQTSPMSNRSDFTKFPTNFLERPETPTREDHVKRMDDIAEGECDRTPSDPSVLASKVSGERHLRSGSSTTDGGIQPETRQRANSRVSRRPPRHSLTPSSIADSDVGQSNSTSPLPTTSADGTPTNTPTVITRRRAAEIASSTTPPMKTRAKAKLQNS